MADSPNLSRCNKSDRVIALIFYINFALFIGAYVFCLVAGHVKKKFDETIETIFLRTIALETAVSIVTSTTLSVGALLLARFAPSTFLHFMTLACAVLILSYALLLSIFSNVLLAILMSLCAIYILIVYHSSCHDIPLSARLLYTASAISSQHLGLYYISILIVLCTYLYLQLAGLSWVGLLVFVESDFIRPVSYYLGLSTWWTVAVLFNYLRTVIATAFVNFFEACPGNNTSNSTPSPQLSNQIIPIQSSSGRASCVNDRVTSVQPGKASARTHQIARQVFRYGMPGICAGSLLVFFITMIHGFLSGFIGFFSSSYGEFMAKYERNYNYFAFNRLADGLLPYCMAANETWDRMQITGVSRVYSGNYAGWGVFLASQTVAFTSAFITMGVRMWLINSDIKDNLAIFLHMSVSASVISVLSFLVVTSGILSILVVLADDPTAVRRKAPKLYSAIIKGYPSLELDL